MWRGPRRRSMSPMHSDLHIHLAKAIVAERVPPRHPQPRTVRRGLLALIRPA